MKNIIESQLSEADRRAITDSINSLETALAGKTGTLDAAERTRYGSINEQNKLVVNKAWEYRQSQPALSSPGVDWTGFESDFEARTFLENSINRLKAIVHSLESTKIMHDYDNFQDALKDYGYSQYQHGAGEDGYSAKVEDFKQFFTRSGRPKPPEDDDGKTGDNGDSGGINTT
jgi:hypothetical protein